MGYFNIEVGARLHLFSTRDDTTKWYRQLKDICRVPIADGSEFHLWEPQRDPSTLTVPRGMMKLITGVFDAHRVEYRIDDKRLEVPCDEYTEFPIDLRPHQIPAVEAILTQDQGIVVAPPGAGKTVAVLEAIRKSNQKALIIVDKLQIMEQWKSRCEEFLGFTPSCVGGGIETNINAPITIGMQQTLARRADTGDYGFVCLDECHHVSANTYFSVFSRYPAKYRIGVSATPTREDGLEKMALFGIGPIIHTVTDDELTDADFMVRPYMVTVKTGFKHSFWSDHFVEKNQICHVPGCKKLGLAHGHRNNYAKVISALAEDKARNDTIAQLVYINKSHSNLIVSDRLTHLDALRDAIISKGFDPTRVHMLTGRENAEERAMITRYAGYGECAILSTIAKEALDIPRLDRLYLAWPVRKSHILEQQIGRITRAHPDKTEAIAYDFQDASSVLANQARQRNTYYYNKKLDVKEISP